MTPRTVNDSRPGRYVPLATIAVAVFLALAVLPSALNLPQSNPSTTLEYAPVPPSGKDATPPAGGNLSSLGLASSGTLGFATEGGTLPAGAAASGVGKNPSTKRCVGKPPRQTEDPMSPPCVAYFEGNNFGATYQGVTRNEITVLIAIDGGVQQVTGTGYQSGKAGTYCDLDLPPDASPGCTSANDTREHGFITALRGYAKYFNDRFQTYGRHVHYWVYWARSGGAEVRRADAAGNSQKLRPFAVVDDMTNHGNNDAYATAMADRGVLTFGSNAAQPASFFAQYAPRVWSFPPDVEHWVAEYVDYVCTKIAPNPVTHAEGGVGNDGKPFNGRQRRFAFMYTTDARYPGLQRFAQLARQQLREKCHITPVAEVSFPRSGAFLSTGGDPRYPAANAATLKQADATTILWLGGLETRTGEAADQIRYYPEIVFAGDGDLESTLNGGTQNANWFRNAWGVTYTIRVAGAEENSGVRACREGDPNSLDGNCQWVQKMYRQHFMSSLAIQVAGPRLTPESLRQGMHAIPRKVSTDPLVAACYFDSTDYTCTKDGMQVWWDATGQAPGQHVPGVEGAAGCFRMVQAGRRFVHGSWSAAGGPFANTADPCNGYENTFKGDTSTPSA